MCIRAWPVVKNREGTSVVVDASVILAMIAGPSDTDGALDAVCQGFEAYNRDGIDDGRVVLPVHWTTHGLMGTDGPIQEMINDQILKKSDMIVAVFNKRLGSPTERYLSGTLEEIAKNHDAGRRTLVFFNANDEGKEPELIKFEKNMMRTGWVCRYAEHADIERKIIEQVPRILKRDAYIRQQMYAQVAQDILNILFYVSWWWIPLVVLTALAAVWRLDAIVFGLQLPVVTFIAYGNLASIVPRFVPKLIPSLFVVILSTAIQAAPAFSLRAFIYEKYHPLYERNDTSLESVVAMFLAFGACWATVLPFRFGIEKAPYTMITPYNVFRFVGPGAFFLPIFLTLLYIIMVVAAR